MKSNKNKPFRLRFFWPFSIFLGILFFLLVFFTSANDDIESTEEHLADTVNYWVIGQNVLMANPIL